MVDHPCYKRAAAKAAGAVDEMALGLGVLGLGD